MSITHYYVQSSSGEYLVCSHFLLFWGVLVGWFCFTDVDFLILLENEALTGFQRAV